MRSNIIQLLGAFMYDDLKIKIHAFQDVKQIIQSIDKQYHHYLFTDEWYSRYKHARVAVLSQEQRYLGYMFYVPITPSLYQAYQSGVIYGNDNVVPSMFVKNSPYVFLSKAILTAGEQNKGYSHMLYNFLIQEISDKRIVTVLTEKMANMRLYGDYSKFVVNENHVIALYDN